MLTFLSLMFGTFVSEDLACVTAGLLIQRGQIEASSAVVACTLGIFAGDVGLWAIGRACLHPNRLQELRLWLDHHAGWAIVASRFLPGSRLPLYVLAGLVRLPGSVFATWALLGTLLWTPALVLLTATAGDAFVARMSPVLGSGVTTVIAAAVMVLLLHGIRLNTRSGGMC